MGACAAAAAAAALSNLMVPAGVGPAPCAGVAADGPAAGPSAQGTRAPRPHRQPPPIPIENLFLNDLKAKHLTEIFKFRALLVLSFRFSSFRLF